MWAPPFRCSIPAFKAITLIRLVTAKIRIKKVQKIKKIRRARESYQTG